MKKKLIGLACALGILTAGVGFSQSAFADGSTTQPKVVNPNGTYVADGSTTQPKVISPTTA